jgi:hypothetical protein
METSAQRCARIVTALEDLVAQEAAGLANRDFPAVLALQPSIAPLVDFLVASGNPSVEAAGLRSRVLALHHQRRLTTESLGAEVVRARVELQQLQVNQHRVGRIAPVYGQAATASRPQLQAVG